MTLNPAPQINNVTVNTNYLIILYSEIHEYWFIMWLYKVCCVTIGLHLTREQQKKRE